MGLFICDECDVLENMARGHFLGREFSDWFEDVSKNGKALCSQCTPTNYSDGTPTNLGVWHGHFERMIMTSEYLLEHHSHNDYRDFNYLGKFEYLRSIPFDI